VILCDSERGKERDAPPNTLLSEKSDLIRRGWVEFLSLLSLLVLGEREGLISFLYISQKREKEE